VAPCSFPPSSVLKINPVPVAFRRVTNPCSRKPGCVGMNAPLVVGKLVESVELTTVAIPVGSTAIPARVDTNGSS
jgi:hypothetical protein